MSSSVPRSRQSSAAKREHRIYEIPIETFNHMVGLTNQGYDRDTVRAWVDTLFQERPKSVHADSSEDRDIVQQHLQAASQSLQSSELSGSSGSDTPCPASEAVRYVCHRCGESLKYSKDFIRHVEEKCEVVREWRCLDCSKTYKRPDRFRKHHKDVHLCDRDECKHANVAEYKFPRRAVHGCGFCIFHVRSNLREFLNHLIRHYNEGCFWSNWNWTMNVESLLQQKHVRKIWEQICRHRLPVPSGILQAIQWTPQSAKYYIDKLEHELAEEDMLACLQMLLENGLGGHFEQGDCSVTGEFPNHRVSLSITTASASVDGWTASTPTEIQTPVQHAVHDDAGRPTIGTWHDTLEDNTILTPATFVNLEELWNAHQAAHGKSADLWMIHSVPLMELSIAPSFDWTAGSINDGMELDDGIAFSSQFEPAHNFDGAYLNEVDQVSFMDATILPYQNMIYAGDIPHMEPDSTDQSCTLPFSSSQAMPDVLDSSEAWDAHSDELGTTFWKPYAPLNPTPPLKPPEGHRRSISGRILNFVKKF